MNITADDSESVSSSVSCSNSMVSSASTFLSTTSVTEALGLSYEKAYVNENGVVSYKEAERALLKNLNRHREGDPIRIHYAAETDSGFVFTAYPDSLDINNVTGGYMYFINKSSGEMSDYSPIMNPEEFKRARIIV